MFFFSYLYITHPFMFIIIITCVPVSSDAVSEMRTIMGLLIEFYDGFFEGICLFIVDSI